MSTIRRSAYYESAVVTGSGVHASTAIRLISAAGLPVERYGWSVIDHLTPTVYGGVAASIDAARSAITRILTQDAPHREESI